MDRRRWRMTSAAGGLRHPEPKKISKNCDNWFCPKIWRRDVSVRSLFRSSWPRIRWNVAWWSLEKHSCHHPTTVLSGSRSEWLLAVPYSENGLQGDAFRNRGGHQIECNGRTPEDSKRSLLPVLPTLARSMEKVCVCARVLHWRWLDKRCHMSYRWSAIPQLRELFDFPSHKIPIILAGFYWNLCFLDRCSETES